MATQRYISTSFWDDPWVQSLEPSEKFIYLYLLTNPLTNIAGIYEITDRRISFDTGYDQEIINRVLIGYTKAKKAYRYLSYIVLPSWPKHQKWEKSPKIKAGIDLILNNLPVDIKKYTLSIGYQYPLNYSDLDLDKDIDSDKDINTLAVVSESPIKDIMKETWSYWNSKINLPNDPFMPISLRDPRAIREVIQGHGIDKIKQCIDKLDRIYKSHEGPKPSTPASLLINNSVTHWLNVEEEKTITESEKAENDRIAMEVFG